jgi:aromatic ring-cleaving dioxygenase
MLRETTTSLETARYHIYLRLDPLQRRIPSLQFRVEISGRFQVYEDGILVIQQAL